MRLARLWLLGLLAFCSVHAWATACSGSAHCVQYATAGGGGSVLPSQSVTFGSNNTAGNTLVLMWGQTDGSGTLTPPSSVTDTNSNTWYIVPVYAEGTGGAEATLWVAYAPDCNAGADTVTISWSSNQYSLITAIEEPGIITPYAFDSNAVGGSATTTVSIAPAIVPSGATDVLVSAGYVDYANSGTWGSPTSGFNLINTVAGGTYFQMATYDQVATAGSYPNTLTNSGVNRNFVGMTAAFRTVAPTVGTVQAAFGITSSGTSVTTSTLPYTTTSGSFLLASVVNNSTFGITSVTGCSQTWQFLGQDQPGGNTFVYYAPNASSVAAGSCSVTFAVSGSATSISASISEVIGVLSAYPLGQIASSAPSSGLPISTTLALQETNLFLYSVIGMPNSFNVSTVIPPSSGFISRGSVGTGGSKTALMISDSISTTVGSYTSSTTVSGSGGSPSPPTQILIAFRTALYSPSVLQTTCGQALTSTSLTVTPLTSSLPAGTTRVAWFTGSNTGTLALSDTGSDTFQLSAANSWFADSWIAYAPNASGGAVTLTDTTSGTHEMCIFDIYGAGTMSPVWGQTQYHSFTSSTTVPSGSVVLPSGTYVLLGLLARNLSNTYTVGAGWGTYFDHNQSPSTTYLDLVQADVQLVTSAGTYNHNVTANTSISQSSNAIFAFGTTNNTNPRPIQSMSFENNAGSVSKALFSPLKAGDEVVVETATDSLTPSVCSDSQSNSFTTLDGGTGSVNYGIFRFTAQAGADTVTCSGSGSGQNVMNIVEYTPMGATDCVASAWNASSASLSSGNCAVTDSADLVMTFGTAQGPITHAVLNPDGSWITPRQLNQGEEGTSADWFDQFPGETGNYSATWTLDTARTLSSTVVALTPRTITQSNQPVVQIITKLQRELDPQTTFLDALR